MPYSLEVGGGIAVIALVLAGVCGVALVSDSSRDDDDYKPNPVAEEELDRIQAFIHQIPHSP